MTESLEDAVACGPDQPQRFLAVWLGPPTRSAQAVADDHELPADLARWHAQVSRWGHDLVLRQNRVPDEREMDGEVQLVGIEAQAVWVWGVRHGDDNPRVLERPNEAGAVWTDTGERLGEFLWHFTVVEAVFGCRYGLAANDVTGEQMTGFTEAWARVAAKPWLWPGPGQSLWTRGDALAWTIVNDRPGAQVTPESTWSIFVGAPSSAALLAVEDAGIQWDWDARLEQTPDL